MIAPNQVSVDAEPAHDYFVFVEYLFRGKPDETSGLNPDGILIRQRKLEELVRASWAGKPKLVRVK